MGTWTTIPRNDGATQRRGHGPRATGHRPRAHGARAREPTEPQSSGPRATAAPRAYGPWARRLRGPRNHPACHGPRACGPNSPNHGLTLHLIHGAWAVAPWRTGQQAHEPRAHGFQSHGQARGRIVTHGRKSHRRRGPGIPGHGPLGHRTRLTSSRATGLWPTHKPTVLAHNPRARGGPTEGVECTVHGPRETHIRSFWLHEVDIRDHPGATPDNHEV